MDQIAQAVLTALGNRQNVLTNTVCMTRLRVTLKDPHMVDFEALNAVPNVLGTAVRGYNGLEVVFGPRTIDGVYHAFLRLTGLAAGTDALFPMSRQESNLKVHINTTPSPPHAKQSSWDSNHLDDDDVDTLRCLFAEKEPAATDDAPPETPVHFKLLVLNGPNVNMLGIHKSQNEGTIDFLSILELCKQTARKAGFRHCVCLQSNHEGDLVDWIQDAWLSFDCVVINPTSYARTSNAMSIAIKEAPIPCAQVCLNKEDAAGSLLSDACVINILDEGVEGYAHAISALSKLLAEG